MRRGWGWRFLPGYRLETHYPPATSEAPSGLRNPSSDGRDALADDVLTQHCPQTIRHDLGLGIGEDADIGADDLGVVVGHDGGGGLAGEQLADDAGAGQAGGRVQV